MEGSKDDSMVEELVDFLETLSIVVTVSAARG
jgi:hypothetical protein